MGVRSGADADRAILGVDQRDKKCGPRYMNDPSLTVIIDPRSTLSTTIKVNVIHTPLEVVHGVRVGPPIWARHGSGFPFSIMAFFLFLKALRSLLLFLANAVLLISLPTNTPGGYVRTRRVPSRLRLDHGPFSHCLITSSSIPGRYEFLIDQFATDQKSRGKGLHTLLAGWAPTGNTLVASAGTHCIPLTGPVGVW